MKGGILLGILITWVLGIICQLTGLYQGASLLPDFSQGLQIGSIADVAFKLDFSNIFSLDFLVVVFAFLFVDMFDTLEL